MVRKSRLLLAPVAFATGLLATSAQAGGGSDNTRLAEAVANGQCVVAEMSSGNTKGPSHDERVVTCRQAAPEVVVVAETPATETVVAERN